MLNGRGIELVGQLAEHGFTRGAIVPEYPDFDQAVGVERRFGFFDHGGCQAIATDHDDRIKMVCIGAKNLAFCRSELNLRHTAIIPARTDWNESKNAK